ncbi:tyrosine-type recombinase/integrase [Streptomyces lydicus]|uniref:tyrosine-type recombinase/integrase n=1 Tax=Streptomyces lydicus TaxID=47763 RepID=UPI00370183C5
MSDPIKKLPPNAKGKVRYRFVVDVGIDPVTGKRKQLTVTKDTLKEARTELGRIHSERGSGTFVTPNRITLGEWLDEWLKRKARDVEPTTIRSYRLALVHVHDQLGHVRLQDLTEDHVQDFVDRLVRSGRRKGGEPGTGLAVSTVEGILIRLREALARAAVRKLVATNVAQYVKISLQDKKKDKKNRRREKPWTLSEVQKFIKGIERDRLYAPLLLSLMGLRPAEVCGMRWTDVDLKLSTLETANTRTMIGNKTVLEKDTKTLAGERVLPLPSKAADALKKFRARQAREKLSAGEGYTDSEYVAVNELGEPLNTRHLREHAYRLMRELEMRRVRLYDARHSCLSYLAVNDVPDVVLAAWAGHTNAAFTKAKYVHVAVEDLRTAAAAWDTFHGAGPTGSESS